MNQTYTKSKPPLLEVIIFLRKTMSGEGHELKKSTLFCQLFTRCFENLKVFKDLHFHPKSFYPNFSLIFILDFCFQIVKSTIKICFCNLNLQLKCSLSVAIQFRKNLRTVILFMRKNCNEDEDKMVKSLIL